MVTGDTRDLLSSVLILVVREADTRQTVKRLATYEPETVTALTVDQHGGEPATGTDSVTEKGDSDVFAAVREVFPDADVKTVVSNNVIEMIRHTARDVDASSIVVGTETNGQFRQLFASDWARELASRTRLPVLVLSSETP